MTTTITAARQRRLRAATSAGEIAALYGASPDLIACITDRPAELLGRIRNRQTDRPKFDRTVEVFADGRERRMIGPKSSITAPAGTWTGRAPSDRRQMSAAERTARSRAAKARVTATLATSRARRAAPRPRTAAELHTLTLQARARQRARHAQQQRDLELRHLRGQSGIPVLVVR